MLRSLRLIAVAALVLAGCGRLGFEPSTGDGGASDAGDIDMDGGLTDGGATDGGALDGGVDAGGDAGAAGWENRPLCGFAPFAWTLTTPEPIDAINEPTRTELEAHLLPDELTLYFAAFESGTFRVFETTRADDTMPFEAPSLVPGLGDDAFSVYHVAPATDVLSGVAASDRGGGAGASDLWHIERTSELDPWTFAGPLPLTNSTGDEHDPWLSVDGLRVYFVSDGLSGRLGGQALFVSSRPSVGAAFGGATVLSELESVFNEDNPSLTGDELTIVFGSNRAGETDRDLYIASRTSAAEPFGEPAPLIPVNTTERDAEGHLSADGCELFFTRLDTGNGDIYLSRVVAR